MVDIEIYKAREARCREQAKRATDPDVKWLYEDMAIHYRKLIARGAYDADVRVPPFTRDD